MITINKKTLIVISIVMIILLSLSIGGNVYASAARASIESTGRLEINDPSGDTIILDAQDIQNNANSIEQLNSNLTDISIRYNSETGKPEWKQRGADTYHPFNSIDKVYEQLVGKVFSINAATTTNGAQNVSASTFKVYLPINSELVASIDVVANFHGTARWNLGIDDTFYSSQHTANDYEILFENIPILNNDLTMLYVVETSGMLYRNVNGYFYITKIVLTDGTIITN